MNIPMKAMAVTMIADAKAYSLSSIASRKPYTRRSSFCRPGPPRLNTHGTRNCWNDAAAVRIDANITGRLIAGNVTW